MVIIILICNLPIHVIEVECESSLGLFLPMGNQMVVLMTRGCYHHLKLWIDDLCSDNLITIGNHSGFYGIRIINGNLGRFINNKLTNYWVYNKCVHCNKLLIDQNHL